MMTLNVRMLLMLLVVMALSILPMPSILVGIRPPWVLLFVLYIQFFLPQYFSIWAVFLMGLCLDVLLSTALGNHAFALLLITWIASSRVRRFHIFPLAQQMILMAVLCFLYQFTLYIIDIYQGFSNTLLEVLGTTLVSILLWPWLSVVLVKWFNLPSRQRMNFM